MARGDEGRDPLGKAARLHAAGRFQEAERAYRQLAERPVLRGQALQALAELYLQTGREAEAVRLLEQLTRDLPDLPSPYIRLAMLADGRNDPVTAIGHYQRLLLHRPELASVHFNLGLLYRRTCDLDEAMAAYRRAVELGIRDVEEAWSNMGVIEAERRRRDEAEVLYRRALDVNPDYVPALFNLATLLEEGGDASGAAALFEHILVIDPGYWEALTRLAAGRRVTADDDPMPARLRAALQRHGAEAEAVEALSFALGKVLDDLGRHEEAYGAFERANARGRARQPRYDRSRAEADIRALMEVIDRDWVGRHGTGATGAPVFICGMFRSGSSLVEQMLSRHPGLTAAGELPFLRELVTRQVQPWPGRLRDMSREDVELLAREYLRLLRGWFPSAGVLTDKRPDNFLYMGLLKAMFPGARFVYTRRAPLDNCLSIYFQHLGSDVPYATDLGDIADYYLLHDRLMAHWRDLFGQDIHTVRYEELVASPAQVLRGVTGFLDLPWDERCLDFSRADNLVKTASVWQVREGLYTRSVQRWRNYASWIGPLLARFPASADRDGTGD